MTDASYVGIGPILGMAPISVPETLRKAFSTSLLWSERVSLHENRDFASKGFYDGLTDEIGQIGWTVTDASSTTYSHDGDDGTPSSVLKGIAAASMPASAIRPLTVLMDRIEAGVTDAKLGAFLTTWWASVGSNASSTVFSTSPLTLDQNGQATATLAYLDFGLTATSWQSFFAARVTNSTQITLTRQTISLNSALWHSLEPKIVQRLGQAALDDIATLDL